MLNAVAKRIVVGAAVLVGLVGIVGAGVSVATPVHSAPAVVAVAHTAAAPAKKPSAAPQNLLGVGVTTNGVNMRACASTSCAVVGTANQGNNLHSWCFVSGQTISGTPFWDIVYNGTTGRAGFITEALLTDQSQGSLC